MADKLPSYRTTLTNNRRKSLQVREHDGSVLVELEPGQSFEVESINKATTYAKWSEVTWHEGGKGSFISRTNWVEPERGRWTIRMLNQDGAEVEQRQLADKAIFLPRSVPVTIGLTLTDPLVRFQSLTIKHVEVKTKSPFWDGYLVAERVLKDVTEPRSASELDVIGKLLDEL